MAFTIQQLQEFSNTKPEVRQITEEIIDYLEANPSTPGGSSYLVYTALISQSGTDAPTSFNLKDSIGVVGNEWTIFGTGDYAIGTNLDFPGFDKIYIPGHEPDTNPPAVGMYGHNNSTLIATYRIYVYSDGGKLWFEILFLNSVGGAINLSDIISNKKFGLPEIRVYP